MASKLVALVVLLGLLVAALTWAPRTSEPSSANTPVPFLVSPTGVVEDELGSGFRDPADPTNFASELSNAVRLGRGP